MAGLTEAMRALIESGVSHQIGACTAEGRPTLCRGLAAEEEPDGRMVVIVSAVSGCEVLAALRETGRISLNMTRPEDHRSLNLKGRDAEVDLAAARYRPLVDARHRAFRAQLARYGFAPGYTDAWYAATDAELVAVRFTPLGAWNQTPGPGAGDRLELVR